MLTYEQNTGRMLDATGKRIATGYSGGNLCRNPEGKNNPDMQNHHNVGPLPRGRYLIEPPVNSKTHGPYAMNLVPDPQNEMFGRDAFLIHGDSVVNPGCASEGCIILDRVARTEIWAGGDHELLVIRG